MLLAVDVGNTNIVFGTYDGSALKQTFRIASDRTRTDDEYGVLIEQLLATRRIAKDAIDAAIIASVVPPLTDVVAEAIRHSFAREPLVVGGPGIRTGISVLYDNPRDVGADRIVNAVAAFELVKGGVIVVDFGTATTFDCISPKSEYLGGVIVPGVQVSLDGLLAHAAKLTRVEIAEPPSLVGKNTTHALQSGIVHGYASLVDGLVEKLEAELGFSCNVIATGGLSKLVAKHCTKVTAVHQNLTLEGLRLIYERNRVKPDAPAARARKPLGV